MALFKKVWSGLDFWDKKENKAQRDTFAQQDEEERRRRAREAAMRQLQRTGQAPRDNYVELPQKEPKPQFDFTSPLSKVGSQSTATPAPKPEPAPEPQQEFVQLRKSGEENKKILGRNAAWLLPKSLEKRTVLSGDGTSKTDKNTYLTGFDNVNKDYQDILIKSARERAAKGDQAALNTIKVLEDAGKIEKGGGRKKGFLERGAEISTAPGRSVQRVGTGFGQSASGLYDLATPGKGTNRFSQVLDKVAKKIDKDAADAGVSGYYKAGNVAGEALATIIPGQALAKTATAEKGLAKVGGKYTGAIAEDFIESVPFTIKQTGQKSSKGEDVSAKQLAIDAGTGALSAGVLKGLGGGFSKVLNKFKGTDNAVEDVARVVESEDAPSIPGQLKKTAQEADETPSVTVADGVKSTNLAKAPEQAPIEVPKPNVVDNVADALPTKSLPDVPTRVPEPARNIPDPGAPLVKVGDEVPTPATNPQQVADFRDSINVPLQKAEVPEPVAPAPIDTPADIADNVAQGQMRINPELDAQGNPTLVSDAQLSNELTDAGVVPNRGDSAVAATEQDLQDQAAKAVAEEVNTPYRVSSYDDPISGETIVLDPERLAREITELRSIPANQRTQLQLEKLKDLTDMYRNWEDVSVVANKPGSEELYPNFTPEGRAALEQTMAQLDPASRAVKDLEGVRSLEKGNRIAEGGIEFQEAGGGEEGMRAKLSALKGEYSKSNYEPVNIPKAARDEVLNDVEKSTKLRDFQKLNTQQAFRKLWGDVDQAPTKADVKYIRNYYNDKQDGLGDVISKQIEDATAGKGAEDFNLLEQIAAAPRTLMTTLDFSSPRQAGVLMARHPIEGTKAFFKGIGYAFNKGGFEDAVSKMANEVDANGVNYSEFIDSAMGIQLPSLYDRAREEAMSSVPLLEKVPVAGRLIKASDRSFSGTLTNLRYNVAKNWVDNVGGVDEVMKNFSGKELEDMGEALNTLSGRGGKRGGFTDEHAKVLSKTLFSGRLWASRLNMLNPYWYYRLSGPARKEALSSAAAFAAMAGTVLTMADALPGVEVGKDPRSADFAKIKIGNTRYDILGGLQQNIRVGAQVLTGKKINSATGEEQDTTPANALGGFMEGKLNPMLGYGWKMAKTAPSDDGNPLTREDQYGNDVNVATEFGKLLAPLNVSELPANVKESGSLAGGIARSIPGVFGAGVQTYGGQEDVPKGDKKIKAALENGEYDQAIAGYKAEFEKEYKKKEPSEKNLRDIANKITEAEFERDGIPTSDEGIKARMEDGDYDKALTGLRYQLAQANQDPNKAKSTKQKMKDEIKRLEVTQEKAYGPEVISLYSKISQSQWRAMGDPESEDYNPDMYDLLYSYDQDLADAGVSLKEDNGSKPKYKAKGSGKGKGGRGGRGGKAKSINTSIATQNPSGSYQPLKARAANFSSPESAIPVLEKVPNYDRSKLKKINVTKGGRG